MQKIFILLSFLCVATGAFAQNNKNGNKKDDVQTYYAESFTGRLNLYGDFPKILEIRRSPKQAAGQLPRLPVHKWVKVFDPNSQKLLATIRLVRLRMPYRYSYQYDSSFVLVLHDKEIHQTYAFDNATKTLSLSDSNGVKRSAFTFLFTPKKNSYTARYFYKNGQVSSEDIYENDYFANVLGAGSDYLQEKLLPLDSWSDKTETHIAAYFYNGKPYWSADIIRKTEADEEQVFYKNMIMQDSTGKKLNPDLYYNPQKTAAEKKGVWLAFHTNGRLKSTTDYRANPDYTLETTYKKDGKTIDDKTYTYEDTQENRANQIALKEASFKKSMFTRGDAKKVYTLVKSNSFYTKITQSTPLWVEKRDTTGKLVGITIAVAHGQSLQWSAAACPPTPPFVHEGAYLNTFIPEGEHRLYAPDSLGKKKALLALMTFKNGMPHGKAVCLSAAGDTLASAVYTAGKITYNKYYKACLHANFASEFIIDSIETLQKGINKRAVATNNLQHRLYEKNLKTTGNQAVIWQRDSLYSLIKKQNYSTYLLEVNVTLNVLEHLAATNGSVRVRRFTSDGEASYFRYDKKTEKLDSVYTELDAKGKIICHFDPEKHAYKGLYKEPWDKKSYEVETDYERKHTYMTWEMPNDSVRISSYYNTGDTLLFRMVDSFAYSPSLRQKYKDSPCFPILDLDIQKNAIIEKSSDLFSVSPNEEALNPAYTTTNYEYIPQTGKLYKTTQGKNYTLYDENEKPLPRNKNGFYDKDISYSKTMKTTTNYTENGETVSGIKTFFSPENTKDSLAETRCFYENKIPVRWLAYTKGGRLIQKKRFDSATNHLTDTLYTADKRLMQVREQLVLGNNTIIGVLAEAYCLLNMQQYYTDSTQKTSRVLNVQFGSDSIYTAQSWYPSGKPRLVAHFPKENRRYDSYTLRDVDFRSLQTNPTSLQAISNYEALDFLEHWENGSLRKQGGTSMYCAYDEKGVIKTESLTNNALFTYPTEDNKAECAWQNLPYQEGKFSGNKRVGEWRGYFRDNKKKLRYRINYDENGLPDGDFQLYNSDSLPLITRQFKKNKLDGEAITYKEGRIEERKLYKNGTRVATAKYDKKGNRLTQENYTANGAIQEKLSYDKATHNLKTHTIHQGKQVIDSSFDGNGKLISLKTSINKGFGETVIRTERDSSGIEQTTITIQNIRYFATHADYLKAKAAIEKIARETAKQADDDDDSDDKVFGEPLAKNAKLQALTPVSSAKLADFKAFTIEKDSLKEEIISESNYISFEPQQEASYHYLFAEKTQVVGSAFTLRDSIGHRFIIKRNADADAESSLRPQTRLPKGQIAATIYYKPYNKDKEKDPIELNPRYSGGCGGGYFESKAPLEAKKKQNSETLVSIDADNLQTTIEYAAALLHPATAATENAQFTVFMHNLELLNMKPHTFIQRGTLSNWRKQLSKQQLLARLNKLPFGEKDVLITDKTNLPLTESYEMKQTGVTITPCRVSLILGAPLAIENREIDLNYNDSLMLAPMPFPFHQTTNANGAVSSDHFLKRAEIRLLIANAELDFPLNSELKTLEAHDILLADNEINGHFLLSSEDTKNTAFTAALKAFCAAKHIDILIDKEPSKWHFRVAK